MIESSPGDSWEGLSVLAEPGKKRHTLIESARHLAAAVRGGGAHFSVLNANSNIERSEVTNRRRWIAKDGAIKRRAGEDNAD